MTYGAGIGAQLGIATESTFGTYATVSRFYEFNSESTQYRKNTVEGMGLRAGGVLPRSQRRVVATFDAGGEIELDLPTRGLGLLLGHATATLPTPTTVTTGVYSYVYTLGDPAGKSFSAQVGVPQYDGTVTAKTLTGCKVSSFELAVSNAGIATGKFSVDASGFTTSTALATASYPANGSIFHFAQGAVSIDGSAVANVRDFSLSVDNTLKVDRYNLGASGAKSEQLVDGFRKVSGKMTLEFTDTTVFAKVLSDANASVSITFTGATISGSHKETLTIALSAVKFDGESPAVKGPQLVEIPVSFTAYDNGTDAPLTITYQTADAAL